MGRPWGMPVLRALCTARIWLAGVQREGVHKRVDNCRSMDANEFARWPEPGSIDADAKPTEPERPPGRAEFNWWHSWDIDCAVGASLVDHMVC